MWGKYMKRYLLEGNICGERVRLGRALQKPPMTQEDLARQINLQGMEMTKLILSRIEINQRHVCDGELVAIAQALQVSLDWLCGLTDEIEISKIKKWQTNY